jgi:hypothetical protein
MTRWILAIIVLALQPGETHAADQTRHALECPARAPSEWGDLPGRLTGVQVVSAKRGEKIDDQAPPDLVPDEQHTRSAVLHSIWRMNSDGPDWLFQVWCHYAGTPMVLKLDAAGVKRCEHSTPAAHPDRPPQTLVCD